MGSSAPSSNAVPDTNADELPDLTVELQSEFKHIVGHGSFGIVYCCPRPCARGEDVAVKAVTVRPDINDAEKERLKRSFKRELAIWRRLDHPNIVPLLGKARGAGFGSDYDCMVSTWMPRGTLHAYIKDRETLVTSHRVRLISDVANGLNYLHSKDIVHGDLHPGNVLIDGAENARLADFGLSQVLLPKDDTLTYLRTMSVHHGALMWAAPELVYPKLYPRWNEGGKPRATLNSDIYSLGNVILFVLSGKIPWPDVVTACKQLEKRQTPQRRDFSTIPNDVWKFVIKCWSPKSPDVRPTAQEVVSFVSENLPRVSVYRNLTVQSSERSLLGARPYVIVVFGRKGVGVSSLVNLIVGHPISTDQPHSKTPSRKIKPYSVTLPGSERRFNLWEVPGFGGRFDDVTLLKMIRQIEQSERVDLFIYCLRKKRSTLVVPDTVRRIRAIVSGRQVPMMAVVTELERFESDDGMEGWWETSAGDGHTNGTLLERMCFEDGRFDAHACVTTLPRREVDLSDTLRKRRDRSEEQVRRLMLEQCASHNRTAATTQSDPRGLRAICNLPSLDSWMTWF